MDQLKLTSQEREIKTIVTKSIRSAGDRSVMLPMKRDMIVFNLPKDSAQVFVWDRRSHSHCHTNLLHLCLFYFPKGILWYTPLRWILTIKLSKPSDTWDPAFCTQNQKRNQIVRILLSLKSSNFQNITRCYIILSNVLSPSVYDS